LGLRRRSLVNRVAKLAWATGPIRQVQPDSRRSRLLLYRIAVRIYLTRTFTIIGKNYQY
jgi:hypothetical protein